MMELKLVQNKSVTIRGADSEIVVDRELLIEKSSVFKVMLTNECFEEYNADIVDVDLYYPFLKVLLDYLSGDIVTIPKENIIEVMDGCSRYQFTELYMDIALFVKSNITVNNCLEYLHYTDMYNFKDLKLYVLKYCCKHYIDTPEDKYKIHSLRLVLKSRILNIDESSLLKYVVESNFSNLVKKMYLDEIKLSLVTSNYLKRLILPDYLHEKQVDIRNSLTERTKYRSAFKERQLTDRRCKQERSVIIALNGVENCRTMECLVHNDYEWRLRIPTRILDDQHSRSIDLQCQNYNRYDTATTYDDYSIYVIGGLCNSFALSTCVRYVVRENAWSAFPELPMTISGHSVTMVERRIYVTGGVNSAVNISIFPQAKNKRWCGEPELPEIRSYHCSVGAFGFLYVIGGFLGNTSESPTSSMCRYNIQVQCWEEMPPMGTPRARMSAVVHDTQIYVFGGQNAESSELRSCEKFDIKQNKWFPIADMSQAKSLTAAVLCEGRIYVSGGQSNENSLCTTDLYNPMTDVWHSTHSMRFHRRSHGMAVLKIPEMTSDELVIPDDFW